MSDWKATHSSPRWGKGFFSQSQLPAHETLSWCPYSPRVQSHAQYPESGSAIPPVIYLMCMFSLLLFGLLSFLCVFFALFCCCCCCVCFSKLHASTSVPMLKVPNTGSHVIVWTHKNVQALKADIAEPCPCRCSLKADIIVVVVVIIMTAEICRCYGSLCFLVSGFYWQVLTV